MRLFVALSAAFLVVGCGSSKPREDDTSRPPSEERKPSGQPPADADSALAEMEAAANEDSAAAKRRAEEEDMRRKEAERKRIEAEAKGLEGTGTREGQGEDVPLFEERFADMIAKVRVELQKYRRW